MSRELDTGEPTATRRALAALAASLTVTATLLAFPAVSFAAGPPEGQAERPDAPAAGETSQRPMTPSEIVKSPEIGIDQNLGRQIPLDLTFRDTAGERVRLGDLIGERPVLITPVYYECPMLCTQVLNGLVKALKTMSLAPGRDFDLITFSFDPRETPELAAAKKAAYVDRYGRPEAAAGWHYLVGDAGSVESLTGALGFRALYDPGSGNYAHASGIMVLTPDGRIARYFYGIDYSPRDLRLALVEASEARIGTVTDQVLLLCYRYDPTTGKYSLMIWRTVQVAGVATALLLGAFLLIMLRGERRGENG